MAPITGLRPIRLSNAIIGHTSLRGTSVVRSLSLRLNSVICIRGNNRVVPGVAKISGRTHPRKDRGIAFVARYPRYNDQLMHCRSRTTRCYAGRSNYPARVGNHVRRFVDHHTVGVRKLKPRAISRFCRRKLVRSITSLCALRTTSVYHLGHVKRGSTRGVVRKMRGSGAIPCRRIVFTLNVHFINRAITGGITHTFHSVSSLGSTALSSLVRISRVNRGVTRDVLHCFRDRGGLRLVRHLHRTKIRVTVDRRRATKRASGLRNRSVIVDNMFTHRSHSRCGTLVRGRNKGGINDVSGGADFVLTKRGVNPDGLRGTRGLNVHVMGRRRFLKVVNRWDTDPLRVVCGERGGSWVCELG